MVTNSRLSEAIRGLLDERESCAARVREIEAELEEAASVLLGVPRAPEEDEAPPPPPSKRSRSATRDEIVAALERQQPQTVAMLEAEIGKTTVSLTAATMFMEGKLARRKIAPENPIQGGGPMWYALQESAFDVVWNGEMSKATGLMPNGGHPEDPQYRQR